MTIGELETRANSEAGASLPPAPAGRGRFPRWLLGACVALGALALLVVAAIWIVIAQIDRPWVKSRVVAYARDALGLGIDYEGLELSLVEGVRFRSFRLLTPPALAAGAEDFVRIDDLELRARLWTFAFTEPVIESLRVGNVELALVTDASGRTTTSELFPPGPEPATETRLSQTLRELPSLSIAALDVAHVGARTVELSADGSRRVLGLTNLGMRGALSLGEEGLSGTELALSGAPLALELAEPGRVRRAALGFELDVRSTEPQAAGVDLHVALKEQDLVPGWTPRGDLLALKAMLRFDAIAGRTSIAIEALRALGDALSIEASTEVYDGEGLKVVTSGKARVDMVALPVPIEGVTLDSLVLDLGTRELSWDGARVGGDVDWNGRLSSLTLERAGALTRLRDLKLLGQGVFAGQSGRFDASASVASAESSSPGSRVQAAGVGLSLRGTARELGGAQQLDGEATLTLVSAQARAEGDTVVEVESPTVRARARGTAAGLAAQTLPVLEGELAVKGLRARSGSDRATLANLSGTYSLKQLAVDASAELGVQGDAALALSLPALRVFEGARAQEGRPALSVTGVELRATLPLSLARAGGTVSVDSLRAGARSLADLGLELELASPLGWSPERAGEAEARLSGSLGRFDAGGGSRGSLQALRVLAQKQEGSRYRLELDAAGSSLALAGVPVPGRLSAEVRADAQPAEGALTGSAALRGERGAEVLLGLDAKLDRGAGRVRYSADVSAEKLEAFAELASSVDPRAAQVELAGARLTASARGDLAGVLRQGEGLVPELVERPLGTARGTQSAKVVLRGLDYRGADQSLKIPELALDVESTHRAERGGNASARLLLPELRFEGGGTSLRLSGLTEELLATFERAPDQGMVDVRSSLELASAAQSWLPGYPVRDLRLSGNVQIDRLRSIFLRELTLENPASGSALRAEGTLELLAQGNTSAGNDAGAAAARDATERSAAAGKTIAGRQALSFEGRLTQQLAPLEGLELASHASGSLELPFRLESGGLLGYRLLATLEAKQISFVKKDGSLAIEKLNGRIPVVEEFALLPNGPVLSAGPRTSPLSDTRFFDVHPFLSGNDYVTAESITFGGIAPLGPVAANVRIERSDFVIDQLQTGYSGGQIVGQVRASFRDGDPIVRLRLNATGVRSGKSRDVFDANMALSFVPAAMTLDGKVQIVRASREHLEDILDLLDPFHESANANRVRRGLTLGYPKFVRFQLHDGAVDTKVELGGIAQLIRIDEIRAVPLGPILQKYVAPTLASYWRPAPERPAPERPATPTPPAGVPVESARREGAAGGAGALLKPGRDSAPRVEP